MEEAPVSSYADNMNDAGRETIVEEQTSGKTSDINEKEKQVEMTNFLGAKSAYTETLKITEAWEPMECFRRLDLEGRVIDPEYKVSLSDEELIKMFKTMTRLNVMDNIFYDVQRQGRIAFYMTSFGKQLNA